MPDISFEQLGISAIVCTLLLSALVVVYRNWRESEKKRDELQEKRLEDAKKVHDSLSEPLSQQVTLTKQIYEILLSRNKGD